MKEDWISLLSLALQWEIEDVVQLSISKLTHITRVIDQIVLARKYPECEVWLWDAVQTACTTTSYSTPWSHEDWQRLDKSDLILIAMGREVYHHNNNNDKGRLSLLMKGFGLSPP
jgi:hypothetical protein